VKVLEGRQDDEPNSPEDSDAERNYPDHLDRKRTVAFIAPEQVKQDICSSIIEPNRPLLLPPSYYSNTFVSNPPSMCIVRIRNVRRLLMPSDAQWSYVTEPVCVPASARSDACYNLRLFVQVYKRFLSVGLMLIKGKHDQELSWPFAKTILFSLKNSEEAMNRERGFKCYGNGLSFADCLKRPKSADNVPIGIQCFIPVLELEQGFIRDNSIELHCLILRHNISLSAQVEQLSSTLFQAHKKCFINSFIIEAT